MLRTRIITASIMAPITLACVFLLPPLGYSFFVGAVLVVAAWEWANFAGLSANNRFVYSAIFAATLAGVLFLPTVPILMMSLAWWLLALILVLGYPKLTTLWGNKTVISVIGFVVLVPAFTSLNQLKHFSDSDYLICLLFFLIWGADIGAYFSGKAFGKRKLAPNVSPGKSWAGFVGGVTTAVIIAILMSLYFASPSLGTLTGATFILICALVAVISVLGDLTISMFKRHRDIKDASNLLPGHGGFLDRIDSLLSAGPVFTLYLLNANWVGN